MAMRLAKELWSANEASCVTGVPLKQVHRIIDAGLLGDAAESRNGARVVLGAGLIGLKLAYQLGRSLLLKDDAGSSGACSTSQQPRSCMTSPFRSICG